MDAASDSIPTVASGDPFGKIHPHSIGSVEPKDSTAKQVVARTAKEVVGPNGITGVELVVPLGSVDVVFPLAGADAVVSSPRIDFLGAGPGDDHVVARRSADNPPIGCHRGFPAEAPLLQGRRRGAAGGAQEAPGDHHDDGAPG